MWMTEEAIQLCRLIEQIAPPFGAHVALTGGCLYKTSHRSDQRKDLDVLFYRIRQVDQIDVDGLFGALDAIGIKRVTKGERWCIKATFDTFEYRCVCGWRGTREAMTLHPRQGYGVCPHCWRKGTERMTEHVVKQIDCFFPEHKTGDTSYTETIA